MGNLTEFPGKGNSFLLIDGAKIKDLSPIIYQEEHSHCDALYRATGLASLLEISPWLVQVDENSALLQKCFVEWKHLGAAIVLKSEYQFGMVLEHLRGLVMARLATGDEVVFRFYDPEIARHLLTLASSGEDARRILGPCSLFAIQDRRSGAWDYFYNNQPSGELHTAAFHIHEEHQAAMESAAKRTALRKLELHTANYFPHLLRRPGINEQDWGAVLTLMEEAKTQGLYSSRDIALYINTIGWLGHEAFQDSDVQNLWKVNSAAPGKAIARIAEFAEEKSTEGLVHG